IGFSKEANPDVAATLQEAVARINALPVTPAFLIHTGDISHFARAAEFDTADQILKGCQAGKTFFVPGEHDTLGDGGKGYRQRFGSVTVLNGHIHQVMQKVEGNVTFHTARSTAFPQPAPGEAPGPGPMKVEPERLRSVLGITRVAYVEQKAPLAIVDSALAG